MAEEDNVIRVEFGAQPALPEEAPASLSKADQEKLDVFGELVRKGTVLVTLDARVPGVVVPPHFSEHDRLNLNFCHGYGIADFAYDERGVRASLSFGGQDEWCDVPWSAVWIMRSHVENDVTLFPESIPPEMLTFFAAAGQEEE